MEIDQASGSKFRQTFKYDASLYDLDDNEEDENNTDNEKNQEEEGYGQNQSQTSGGGAKPYRQ